MINERGTVDHLDKVQVDDINKLRRETTSKTKLMYKGPIEESSGSSYRYTHVKPLHYK